MPDPAIFEEDFLRPLQGDSTTSPSQAAPLTPSAEVSTLLTGRTGAFVEWFAVGDFPYWRRSDIEPRGRYPIHDMPPFLLPIVAAQTSIGSAPSGQSGLHSEIAGTASRLDRIVAVLLRPETVSLIDQLSRVSTREDRIRRARDKSCRGRISQSLVGSRPGSC